VVSANAIAFASALLVLAPDALAQATVRDRSGRVIERIESLYSDSNVWVRRDREGRRLGSVERMPYGDYVVRDRRGNRTLVINKR
jgi:predicted Mrr-cat superfamily restriction endonuclease